MVWSIAAAGCIAIIVASSSAMAEPKEWRVQDGGNGHFYDYIEGPKSQFVTWKEAREYAASLEFRGVRGHLATVTTEGEWKFLVATFPNDNVTPNGAWLGGYQDVKASDYKEPDGGWRWITGEPWGFTAWSVGEPNDIFGVASESYLEFVPVWSGRWNDEGQERRLVVEFPVHRTDYKYKAISSGHFAGQDLSGADFSYSVISDAYFEKAKLQKSVIKYAVASDAKFQGSDLRGAVLRYSVLTDARFTEADCRGTDFSYCLLTDADFSGADLRGAIFSNSMLGGRFDSKTVYDETTRFPDGFDPAAKGLTLKDRAEAGALLKKERVK